MTKGTLLVTGAAGYIGTHVCVEILNNDYSLIALDNFANCRKTSEDDMPEPLKRVQKITEKDLVFYNIDICDHLNLNAVFKNSEVDCVIHLAALKSVGQSVKSPLTYYKNNLIGATTLLQVMQDHNVKKLVFASSSTVYGIPQSVPVTEEHLTGQSCTNPYGKSKYFVEEILKDICKADEEFKVISLRYFNPIGAHESGLIGEDSPIPYSIMPNISQVAVGRKEKVLIYGSDYDTKDGTGVRDYTHISDVARGHILALDKINKPSFKGWQAYNMGAGKGCSVLELISTFTKVSGKNIPYEIVGKRKGDIGRNYSNSTKAKNELGWMPTKDFSDMCKDTWRWQSQNPNGYKTEQMANHSD